MEKNAASGVVLTLLLMSMLTLACGIQPVRASETIYIMADGSVNPSNAPIQHDADTYTFTADIYDSIVVEKDNIIVDGNGYTLQGTGTGNGFYLYRTANVTIKNVRINQFYAGVYLVYSTGSTITENNVSSNSQGINVYQSTSCIVSNNTVTSNQGGIILYQGTQHTTVENNTVNSNSVVGIDVGMADWCTITRNNITNNGFFGIWLEYSSSNSIFGNTITANNYYGIVLGDSSSNSIYHNNFIGNAEQAYISDSTNVWDDGYPSGGNYWSDYAGVDDTSDGIGDSPYVIDENNQDRYPLMNPWSSAERKVGIEIGSWAKYSNFDVAWSSNDPDATMPIGLSILKEVEWWRNTVEDILDTKIRYQQLLHFKDGSEYSTTCWIDIDTGSGTPLSFVSSGLVPDDCIYASAPWYAWKINETISHMCAGVNRETNHLNVTTSMQVGPPPAYRNTTGNFYWDKETGVLCELSMRHLNQTESYVTSWSIFYEIVDTNLWGAGWVERKPGVKAGDWAKYGDYVVAWNSNDPGQHPPTDIQEWMNVTVQNTAGTNITFQLVMHYQTSAGYTTIGWQDVSTSDGRGQMGLPLFISADLSAGDTLYQTLFPLPINETIFREYVGAIREVNHVAVERAFYYIAPDKYFNVSLSAYWDRAAGILTEYMVENVFVDETLNYVTSTLISFRIVETNLWEAPTPPTIMARVDIAPDTLNLRSKGKWITAFIQLPEGYNPEDIDASTILLNETIQPVLDPKYGFVTNSSEYLVDHNNDGILERMLKFDRAILQSWIYQSAGMQSDVSLTMTGKLLDGTQFEGTGTISVFWTGQRAPCKR